MNVIEKPAVSGAVYAFDNVVLQTGGGGGGGGGGDTTPPTVPTGVTATATGPTSVSVSWHASSDAGGVAGYDVYRDGTKVGAVGGSTTAYTDTKGRAGHELRVHRQRVRRRPQHVGEVRRRVGDHAGHGGRAGAAEAAGRSGPSDPIVVIMMENKHYADIVGNANAPLSSR